MVFLCREVSALDYANDLCEEGVKGHFDIFTAAHSAPVVVLVYKLEVRFTVSDDNLDDGDSVNNDNPVVIYCNGRGEAVYSWHVYISSNCPGCNVNSGGCVFRTRSRASSAALGSISNAR